MVEIADIKDRESLKAWLDEQPQEVSAWIAHRSAMRLLPIWWEFVLKPSVAKKSDLTALPILRCNLISAVARTMPTADIKQVADAAAGDAAAGDAAAGDAAAGDAAAAAAAYAAYAAADAYAYAVAAYAAAYAAAATAYAAAYAATYWNLVRADCTVITSGDDLDHLPVWGKQENPFAARWANVKQHLPTAHSDETARGADATNWSFWIKWYDDALAGKPPNWKILERIALIDSADWDKGAARVNYLIGEIVAEYTGNGSPLSQTSVADFSFDAARRWMEMIGFEGDVAHLRDPDRVQAFLDDIGEMRDDFQDFIDFTQDVSTGRNAIAVYTSASEKVLRELQRVKDTQHIRARRLITLGGYLYGFSLEEDKRAELGKTLADALDNNVNLLRETCRKHFAPSLVRMSPLDDLELGDADPTEILADLKASLAHIQNADGQELVRLSSEALAVLQDMISELEDLQSAIGEARTDEHRETLRKRFAKGVGGFGATIGRYIEKAKPHSAKAGTWADGVIKGFKRWKSLGDIIEWFSNFTGSGPPPV